MASLKKAPRRSFALLERVLRRDPDHPGANHYYIHAIEASPNPERALGSAARLPNIAPAAGHLVHMPSHIYSRIGDFAAAARLNEEAIEADRAYLERSGAKGGYPMMYFSHNIHFLAYARAMQGRYVDARKAAEELVAHVSPHVKDMPPLEGFMPATTMVFVHFNRWDEILASAKPDAKLLVTTALWHFGRGVAFAARGQLDEAANEQKEFLAARDAVAPEAMLTDWNTGRSVLEVAENVLAARIVFARKDGKSAVELLKKAVKAQDALNYGEPPDWMFPVRETLGEVLLQLGEPVEAEAVFRADLERNRGNGRSFFGLAESLKAQKKDHAARLIRLQFDRAWSNSDSPPLRIEDFSRTRAGRYRTNWLIPDNA